jgi:hypothetical protein
MNSTDLTDHVPAEVRAAIRTFLGMREQEAKPFATPDALGAVRRVFPDLDISDSDLVDAITSEASIAGFDIEADAGNPSKTSKQKSLDRWDNEGGAIGRPLEAQRKIDNDQGMPRAEGKRTETT